MSKIETEHIINKEKELILVRSFENGKLEELMFSYQNTNGKITVKR